MKRDNLFSIGQVSRMFHISISSLRHYENIGLLSPEYISPDSGYRYYGTKQFEVLNTLRYLRTLNMPLSEIEDFLKNKEIDRIEEKLRQQKQIVLKKQQELKRIEKKIERRLRWLEDARNSLLDEICLTTLPSCRIAWSEDSLDIGTSQDMETPIRRLDQSNEEAVVFLGKIGLGISAEHLQMGQTEPYDVIFLLLDEEDIYSGETLTLPETPAVQICFRGSHAEAPAQYRKLLCYINENKMQITGFSREITLIDAGITNDSEKFVTEISIPVCQSIDTSL